MVEAGRAYAGAHVLIMLDSLVAGGAERSTVSLLPYLVDRGFAIDVAMLHDRPGLQDEVIASGCALHDLSGSGGRIGWIRRSRALIRSLEPDLVHTCLFEADVCGRTGAMLARVPSVSTLPTERYGDTHLAAPHLRPAKVRVSQGIDAATARFARRLHAVSTYVADSMAVNLRYPRDRIDVVYRGRSPVTTSPDLDLRCRVRKALGVSDELVVLAVARHEHAKGLDRLIEAMPLVRADRPDAIALIAGGEGGHTAALHSLVAEHGLGESVRFLGRRDDITDLHAAADAFVLPSRREGLPGALLEAMAAGTPSVVGRLPHIEEVVGPSEVHLVDCDDIGATAAAILRVTANRGEAAAMADRARARFEERFTLDRSADGMADFYLRALA